MDIDELKRRERWYELAASIAEADRPRGWLRFWLCPYQVADEPVVAVPTPGAQAPNAPSGVGSGAADSETSPLPTQGRAGFVGLAAPQPAIRPAVRGAATPHPSQDGQRPQPRAFGPHAPGEGPPTEKRA